MIELPPLAAPVDELWHALLDLSERLTVPWTLVGGQMVLLHAIEHGQVPPQPSQDGDIVADIRTDRAALTKVVEQLDALGFALTGFSTDGLAHRWSRPAQPRPVQVDVLAPDGVGGRADLTTTPPGRTVQVPGGTQALDRTERVAIRHEGRVGAIPRPTLLAAIVAKAAAVETPNPARHYRDLALLCGLAPDPFELVKQFTPKDRQRVRMAKALADDAHVAWSFLPADLREQGRLAYTVLAG